MYPLVRGISSKFRQFGLGSLFTCRPCGVITEATEYSLRTAYEVLLRNTPTVSAFNVVKLQTGSHLNAGRPLSRILMDVELGDETPLPVRDLSPSLLKCVEAILKSDEQEAEGVQSLAVGNLKSGLNRLANPRGERGLSDDALKALDSASKMLDTDANVKIVAELLLPLMKGFCVFNTRHLKALGNAQAHNYGMFLPSSVNWKGLALGNPRLWYGELDMLLCPNLSLSVPESGHFPVAVVQKGEGNFPELSVAVESKRVIKKEWSLLGTSTEFSQAYATAIVFSFLCHYKFGMKRSFIPSLLVSPQGFAVFFYDCKEDVMISKACSWSEYSLVLLWSILHYRIFYPPMWAELGNITPPFGYLGSVRPDFRYIDEHEFYFGESLNSPVFKKTHPFAGRLADDVRMPDKGIAINLLDEKENKKDN